MAYVIGRKIIKDTKDFDSYAYGITLPIKNGDGGYFQQSFTSTEQAKSNLINLLLTNKGERVMQPEFGTGLKDLLFEQMDDVLFEDRVKTTILDSVSFWLPYINIDSIEVELTDEYRDKNQANVYVSFFTGESIELQEITFLVQG